MYRLVRFLRCIALMALTISGSSAGIAGESLRLFAASSLTDVAADIAKSFKAETAIEILIVPAASSTLARQIAAGAPADIFLSADPQWAEWLIDQGTGKAGASRTFAGNSLVVVVPPGRAVATGDMSDILTAPGGGRIAIADPEHVPAGRYARQVLDSAGLWQALLPRLVPAANVRDALRYVETGQTPLGIVYATDAKAGNVQVVAALPDPQPVIRYVAVPLGGEGVGRFMAFVTDGSADTILCRYGFRLPEGRRC